MKKLIITGFARSGTSLLANFLNLCGYDLGGSWDSKLEAGFEDEQFQKICTTFQMNSLTEDLILFLQEEIKKIDKIVLKHPRVLYNKEFIRIWTTIFPDTSVLVTYRTPFFALESKRKTGNLGYFTNLSPSELDLKFHEFISQLIHLRIKHKILYFPNFIYDYDTVYHSISGLGIHIDKDRGRSVWANLADPSLVHYGK